MSRNTDFEKRGLPLGEKMHTELKIDKKKLLLKGVTVTVNTRRDEDFIFLEIEAPMGSPIDLGSVGQSLQSSGISERMAEMICEDLYAEIHSHMVKAILF